MCAILAAESHIPNAPCIKRSHEYTTDRVSQSVVPAVAIRHGVARVDSKIHQYLIHLTAIGLDDDLVQIQDLGLPSW